MPRRKTIKVYKFAELSPAVREKVLDRLREHAYDADFITDQLKSILKERGFADDADVCWSLGYCQGDGVAFSGSIYSTVFFDFAESDDHPAYTKKMKESDLEKFLPLRGRCNITVKHEGRECHWNSMEVEMELAHLDGGFMAFVPKEIHDEVLHYLTRKGNLRDAYDREKYVVDQARWKPIRDWERKKSTYDASMKRGPKGWRPPIGPKPPPAEIPDPSVHFPEATPEVAQAIARAEADYARLEQLLGEFQGYMEQWVKDTSRELEKLGYSEIEYITSDEQVIDMIEANDYEFLEDGSISK